MSSLGLGLGVGRFFGRGQISVPEFILQIDTTLGDGLNQMRMPLQSTQPMTIDWGDGTVETVTQTDTPSSDNWVTHTYADAGIYDVKVSNVDKVRFNNEGDKFKPLEVLNWGTYGVFQAIQDRAFFGCNNLAKIADNGDWFDVVTNGFITFLSTSLTSLPSGMELPNLTNGGNMFMFSFLTSLPSGMTLENLTNGFRMFRENSLTSLPAGMTLESLTNGNDMFRDNNLAYLPEVMTLENLTIGSFMFRENSLTSLPAGMTLERLTNGNDMFLANTLNTDSLSSLYIKMSVLNPNNNVPFHGGSGNFDPAFTEVIDGVTYNTGDARADLVNRGWTLTDGGAI